MRQDVMIPAPLPHDSDIQGRVRLAFLLMNLYLVIYLVGYHYPPHKKWDESLGSRLIVGVVVANLGIYLLAMIQKFIRGGRSNKAAIGFTVVALYSTIRPSAPVLEVFSQQIFIFLALVPLMDAVSFAQLYWTSRRSNPLRSPIAGAQFDAPSY